MPQIAAGSSHTEVMKSDGTLWGWNGFGQLGIGNNTGPGTCGGYACSTLPVEMVSDGNWVSMNTRQDHTVAIKSDGTLWAWGSNAYGKLGDDTTTDRFSPVPVGIANVVEIVAGGDHTVALKSDGTVWTWGGNVYGQLGDGTTTERHSPAQVGITNVSSIAASGGWSDGEGYTLALKADGTVWAWGYNGLGQLGLGNMTDKYSPMQVGINNVVALAVDDGNNSFALKADGTVWAWGRNYSGQLGIGNTTDKSSPVPVGMSNAVAVAAGGSHSLALKSDSTVWAWGDNYYGQLGDGTTFDRTSPVQVTGLSDVVAVAAGYAHSLALKSDGTVRAWGWNSHGQVGDGTTAHKHTPVQVVHRHEQGRACRDEAHIRQLCGPAVLAEAE